LLEVGGKLFFLVELLLVLFEPILLKPLLLILTLLVVLFELFVSFLNFSFSSLSFLSEHLFLLAELFVLLLGFIQKVCIVVHRVVRVGQEHVELL
jgi:hypothetical protein